MKDLLLNGPQNGCRGNDVETREPPQICERCNESVELPHLIAGEWVSLNYMTCSCSAPKSTTLLCS